MIVTDVISRQAPPKNSMENVEKIKSPFFLEQIDISEDIMKSNPVEMAAQVARNSSTGSSSVTLTNIEKRLGSSVNSYIIEINCNINRYNNQQDSTFVTQN